MPRTNDAKQFLSEIWRNAIVGARESCTRLQTVNQREHARTVDKAVRIARYLPGERNENAVNLLLLFFDEANKFIVLLDSFKRLNIDGLARGACAMNYARDAPLQLAAHGNDESLAANRDQVFLRGAFTGEFAQRCTQALFNQFLLTFLFAANAIEFRRCAVGERSGAAGALRV